MQNLSLQSFQKAYSGMRMDIALYWLFFHWK